MLIAYVLLLLACSVWSTAGTGGPESGPPPGGDHNVTVISRTCLEEPEPRFKLPLDICMPKNGSCKHEVVTFSNDMEIMCDTMTDGGGWITFQRRLTQGSLECKSVEDFLEGCGDIKENFWFGLDKVHHLCPPKSPCELRIDVVSKDGEEKFGHYEVFSLAGGSDDFELDVGNFTGDGDIMSTAKNGVFQATEGKNCVTKQKGVGWWYSKGCTQKSLNGKIEPLTYTEMKLRRRKGNSADKKEDCKPPKVIVHFVVDAGGNHHPSMINRIKTFLMEFGDHFNLVEDGDLLDLIVYGISEIQAVTTSNVGSADSSADLDILLKGVSQGSQSQGSSVDGIKALFPSLNMVPLTEHHALVLVGGSSAPLDSMFTGMMTTLDEVLDGRTFLVSLVNHENVKEKPYFDFHYKLEDAPMKVIRDTLNKNLCSEGVQERMKKGMFSSGV